MSYFLLSPANYMFNLYTPYKFPLQVFTESSGGMLYMKMSVFLPQTVLSCFVVASCGHKMSKTIAPGLVFLLPFALVCFLVPPCFQ